MTCALPFVLLLFGIAQPQPSTPAVASFDTVKSASSQHCQQFHTLTGKIRIDTVSSTQQVSIHTEALGSYEHLVRKDGKLLFRVDLHNKVTQSANGRSAAVEQSVSTISDGHFAYTLTTQPGQPATALRNLPKPSQTVLADEAFFDGLSRGYHVRVLPDEKIDGKEVWVLEARPKAPAPGRAAKTIHYIQKVSGIRIRSTGHDATGKRVQLTELSDIKIDPPLKQDRFVFKAPAGVKIVDLTQQR